MKKKTGILLVFLFFFILILQIYFSNPKLGWSDDFFVADGGISKIIQTGGYLMIGFNKTKDLLEDELFFTSSEDGKEWSEPIKIFENGSIHYIDFLEKEDATYIIFDSKKFFTTYIHLGIIKEKQIQEIHEFKKIDVGEQIFINSLIFLDEKKILVARNIYNGKTKIYLDILEDGELKNILKLEGEESFLYKDKKEKFWLFYDKDDGKISYMTSADGLDWSEPKEIENSLTGMEPKLYQTNDGTYWLVYSVCTNCETLGLLEDVKKDLCYQTSVDGENWSNPVAIVSGDNISPWDVLETSDGKIILVWSDCKGALLSVFSGEECGKIYVKIYDEREAENDKVLFYLKSFVVSFVLAPVIYVLLLRIERWRREGKIEEDSEK